VRWVDHRDEPFDPLLARGVKVGVVALVAWSILANTAIAFNYSYSLGDRTDHMARLLSIQDAAAGIVGPSLADRTVFLDDLPYERYDPTPPGTLAIVGDCDALYYSNGDTVDTWVTVEYGDSEWRRDFRVTPGTDLEAGYEIELLRLSASPDFDPAAYWFSLVMHIDEVDDDEVGFSLSMDDSFGSLPGDDVIVISRDDPSELSITFDHHRRQFIVEFDGRNILYGHFDMDPLYDAADPGIRFLSPGTYGAMSFEQLTLSTPWCDRLATAASR